LTQQQFEQEDALSNLWTDVRRQRERISKIAEPSPKKALLELNDTGLSMVEDLVSYFLQFRQYVSESLEDVDRRVGSLEDGADVPTLLGGEEATMILKLAATCEAFLHIIRDSSASINDGAEQKLVEAKALIDQVRDWVSENVDDDGDDDLEEELSDEEPSEEDEQPDEPAA